MREFSPAHPVLREHLRVVASYVFNHLQRLTGAYVNKMVLCLAGYLIPELIDDVTGVRNGFRNIKRAPCGLVQIFTRTFERFREVFPGLEYL